MIARAQDKKTVSTFVGIDAYRKIVKKLTGSKVKAKLSSAERSSLEKRIAEAEAAWTAVALAKKRDVKDTFGSLSILEELKELSKSCDPDLVKAKRKGAKAHARVSKKTGKVSLVKQWGTPAQKKMLKVFLGKKLKASDLPKDRTITDVLGLVFDKPLPNYERDIKTKDVTIDLTGDIHSKAVLRWHYPDTGTEEYRYTLEGRKRQLAHKWERVKGLDKIVSKAMETCRGIFNDSKRDEDDRDVASMMWLIGHTGIRHGEQDNYNATGSRGCATLHKTDVKVSGDTVKLEFSGKGEVANKAEVTDRGFAKYVKRKLKDKTSGKFLWGAKSYKLKTGGRELCGLKQFKIHDLRSYYANRLATELFANAPHPEEKEMSTPKGATRALKRIKRQVMAEVAAMLSEGSSTAEARYVDSNVVRAWLDSVEASEYEAQIVKKAWSHRAQSLWENALSRTHPEASQPFTEPDYEEFEKSLLTETPESKSNFAHISRVSHGKGVRGKRHRKAPNFTVNAWRVWVTMTLRDHARSELEEDHPTDAQIKGWWTARGVRIPDADDAVTRRTAAFWLLTYGPICFALGLHLVDADGRTIASQNELPVTMVKAIVLDDLFKAGKPGQKRGHGKGGKGLFFESWSTHKKGRGFRTPKKKEQANPYAFEGGGKGPNKSGFRKYYPPGVKPPEPRVIEEHEAVEARGTEMTSRAQARAEAEESKGRLEALKERARTRRKDKQADKERLEELGVGKEEHARLVAVQDKHNAAILSAMSSPPKKGKGKKQKVDDPTPDTPKIKSYQVAADRLRTWDEKKYAIKVPSKDRPMFDKLTKKQRELAGKGPTGLKPSERALMDPDYAEALREKGKLQHKEVVSGGGKAPSIQKPPVRGLKPSRLEPTKRVVKLSEADDIGVDSMKAVATYVVSLGFYRKHKTEKTKSRPAVIDGISHTLPGGQPKNYFMANEKAALIWEHARWTLGLATAMAHKYGVESDELRDCIFGGYGGGKSPIIEAAENYNPEEFGEATSTNNFGEHLHTVLPGKLLNVIKKVKKREGQEVPYTEEGEDDEGKEVVRHIPMTSSLETPEQALTRAHMESAANEALERVLDPFTSAVIQSRLGMSNFDSDAESKQQMTVEMHVPEVKAGTEAVTVRKPRGKTELVQRIKIQMHDPDAPKEIKSEGMKDWPQVIDDLLTQVEGGKGRRWVKLEEKKMPAKGERAGARVRAKASADISVYETFKTGPTLGVGAGVYRKNTAALLHGLKTDIGKKSGRDKAAKILGKVVSQGLRRLTDPDTGLSRDEISALATWGAMHHSYLDGVRQRVFSAEGVPKLKVKPVSEREIKALRGKFMKMRSQIDQMTARLKKLYVSGKSHTKQYRNLDTKLKTHSHKTYETFHEWDDASGGLAEKKHIEKLEETVPKRVRLYTTQPRPRTQRASRPPRVAGKRIVPTSLERRRSETAKHRHALAEDLRGMGRRKVRAYKKKVVMTRDKARQRLSEVSKKRSSDLKRHKEVEAFLDSKRVTAHRDQYNTLKGQHVAFVQASKKADKKQEAAGQLLEVLQSMEQDYDPVWGSALKQAVRRVDPGFNEAYYGYTSFSQLLQDIASKGLIELEYDDSRGNYQVRRK